MNYLIALLILFTGFVHTYDEQDTAAQAYQRAYAHVLERNWDDASRGFRSYLSTFEDGNHRDGASFWLCFSDRQRGGSAENHFQCFEQFLEDYPRSRWTEDARSNLIQLAHKIAEQGNPTYLAKVESYEKTSDEQMMLAAITALAMQRNPDVSILRRIYEQNPGVRVRQQIVNALISAQAGDSGDFLKHVFENDENEQVRSSAMFALQKIPEAMAMEYFRDRYDDLTATQRQLFLSQLFSSDGSVALPFVMERLKDVSNRQEMAMYLHFLSGMNGDEDEINDILRDLYLKSEDSQLRSMVLMSLRNRNPEPFRSIIKDAIDSGESQQVMMAVNLVQNSDDDELKQYVAALISPDTSADILTLVISQIDVSDDPALRDKVLNVAMNHSSQTASQFALQRWFQSGKVQIGDIRRIVEKSDNWHRMGGQLFRSLDEIGELDWFKNHFAGIPESSNRAQIIHSFAFRQDDGSSLVNFLSWVAENDPAGSVRRTVVMALGQIDIDESRDALQRLIDN